MAKTATGAERDTYRILLESGMAVMFEKGYTNTGIQEVLSAVGVPKGSFYHYFKSKEDFAQKIILHVEENYANVLGSFLRDKDRTPVNRLRHLVESKKNELSENCCRKGCLIGNLSQEMADQSEVLRLELSRVMSRWRDIYAACIDEGQSLGEINRDYPASTLAEMFLCGWEGAIMRSKTQKTVEPIEAFIEILFAEF